jgi:hypothetical protein
VVLDEPDEVLDESIARHIVSVHQRRSEAWSSREGQYDMQTLQGYVKYARTFNPILTVEASRAAIKAYTQLRNRKEPDDEAPGKRIVTWLVDGRARRWTATAAGSSAQLGTWGTGTSQTRPLKKRSPS